MRASQVARHYFAHLTADSSAMTDLPASSRDRLASTFLPPLLSAIQTQTADDGATVKTLFHMFDGAPVETVVMAYPDRATVCVSSQAGCGMACPFCATGKLGLRRNLSSAEIIEQVRHAAALVRDGGVGDATRLSNVVFMGMGEPLANYENLMAAVSVINAGWGLNIGARRITVSTSGIVPRIRDLAGQPRQLRLAISLHGADNDTRDQIMPVNKKYPLEQLLAACADYQAKKKQMITFEFILISGVNDIPAQSSLLAAHARRLNAKINLIPYNPVDGVHWQRPADSAVKKFAAILKAAGVSATVRLEKGRDIDAACGQLRLRELKTSDR
jgi:23S rRNA (adenine2503-C2)-methyltransferase